jgi:hypothetical protein
MSTPIFNDSKYTRWYYAVIQKRGLPEDAPNSEMHHIIPRSLGGSDDLENLVRLSYHDHAWCHWLLTKMTSGAALAKMRYAFNMMRVGGEHMGRVLDHKIVRAYERNRLELIRQHSEFMRGREPWNKGKQLEGEALEQQRERIKNRKKPSQDVMAEANKKRAEKMLGRKQSEETKKKRSKSMTGFFRGPMSESEREKRRLANIGGKKPEGHGAKVAAANKGVISINKNNVEKKVKECDLQMWLDDGWSLGGRPRKKVIA